MDNEPSGNYAEVNGIRRYYEIHGAGRPLVLLHGAYMTIDAMGEVLPRLAESRQVIAVELQAHGRTADVDRPLAYESMADDVAALLRHLEVEEADVFGFSMGGGVALQVAIRHPELVRKLVVASASYTSDSMHPELLEMIPSITPEVFAGSPIETDYLRTAPNPDDFPTLVATLKQLDMEPFAWPPEDVRGIAAPTLLIHRRGFRCRPHRARRRAVPAARRRDGGPGGPPEVPTRGAPWDYAFHPPGSGILDRADWLLAIIPPFLDAPMPEEQGGEGV